MSADLSLSYDIIVQVIITGKAVPDEQGSVMGTVRIDASEFDAADPASVRIVVEDALDKLTYALADKVDPGKLDRHIAQIRALG